MLLNTSMVAARTKAKPPESHMKPEAGTLNNGVLFLRQGTMNLISNRVIVPVTFRYNGLVDQFNRLLNSLGKIRVYLKEANITEDSYRQEIELLQLNLHETASRVQKFFYGYQITHAVPVNRRRRGAVNFVADIGQVLFGFATDSQINNVNAALGNLSRQTDESLHRMNIMTQVVGLNAARLDKLRKAQIGTVNAVDNLTVKVKDVRGDVNNLSKKVSVDHAFNQVSLKMLALYARVEIVIAGIKNMFAGIFNENIIDDKFLLHILSEVKRTGHQLLLPDDYLSLHIYKQITKITSIYDRVSDSFVMYLAIPTNGALELPKFGLFRLRHFPVPVTNGHGLVMKYQSLPNYIAISDQYFIELEDIHQCQAVANTYYCSTSNPLFRFENSNRCSAKLFTGTDHLTFCSHWFAHSAEDKFIKVNNEYYYYVNGSKQIQIVCSNSSLNKEITLTGLGSVKLGPDCEGLGTGLLLPASLATYEKEMNIDIFHKPKQIELDLLNTSILPITDGWIVHNITKDLDKDLSLKEIMNMINMKSSQPIKYFSYTVSKVELYVVWMITAILIAAGIYIWRTVRVQTDEQHDYEVPLPPRLPPLNALKYTTDNLHYMTVSTDSGLSSHR